MLALSAQPDAVRPLPRSVSAARLTVAFVGRAAPDKSHTLQFDPWAADTRRETTASGPAATVVFVCYRITLFGGKGAP